MYKSLLCPYYVRFGILVFGSSELFCGIMEDDAELQNCTIVARVAIGKEILVGASA